MAFGDFTFPQVKDDLGLTVDDANLYSDVPAIWSTLSLPVQRSSMTTSRSGPLGKQSVSSDG